MKSNKELILKAIKEYLNLKNDKDLAVFLGIKQNTLSSWKSRNAIDYDLIISKCDFIDANWLLTGKGPMLKEDSRFSKPNKETAYVTKASDPQRECIEKDLKKHRLKTVISDYQKPEGNMVSIPIVDVSAAAGYGYFNTDHPETVGELSFPVSFLKKRYGNYYCGKVDGESMEPTLLYGDFIIFRLLSQEEWGDLKNGDIYFIVNRSGSSFVKRIKNQLKKEGVIICQSDNPDKQFRDFPIENDDIANIYHVEWRFSKNMTNINQTYFNRVESLEEQMKSIQEIIKNKFS